jgi:thiol-disulfide isomerase/thioredoxin
MRLLQLLVLYTALTLGANTALADMSTLEPLRTGDMKKLIPAAAPAPVPDTAFTTNDGDSTSLAAFRGKYVLLNFWATWCAPCRKEMPMLSALQTEFGDDDFTVLTIATGRDDAAKINRFFESMSITNLPRHRDPNQSLARKMGVFGLPVVVLIDPLGNEIARLTGPADWSSPESRALIAALLGRN